MNTPDMNIPANNAERLEAIKVAGNALAVSIFPATGYNPEKIGNAFADALIKAMHEDCPIETDLGHECLSLVLSATVARMEKHFAEIESKSRFSDMSFPAPSYEGEEDETDDDDERMEAREDESRQS